ncbi:unnamed protein product [Sympodiomycopsis kandeliae]
MQGPCDDDLRSATKQHATDNYDVTPPLSPSSLRGRSNSIMTRRRRTREWSLTAVVLLALVLQAQTMLVLPANWAMGSNLLDGVKAYITNSIASTIPPATDSLAHSYQSSSSSSGSQQLSFKLDMAIHHSTHPDHLGKSATYHFGDQSRSSSIRPDSLHMLSGIQTQIKPVTKLRNPRAYLTQREAILDQSRRQAAQSNASCTDAENQRAFAESIQSLDSLHDLLDWEQEDTIVPDVTKRSTLLALARMSSAAYEAPPDPPAWKPTPGFENWNLSESFGWIDDGIRGHVFSSGPNNEVVVVSLKGTSAALFPGGDDTARRDKLNDNLLFSCCCARVSWTWSPVCPCPFDGSTCSQPCLERSLLHQSVYYPLITDLYNNISYNYPNSQIWVTGHSLGGALASLIGYTFGVPGITYEAPAERMAAKRLHLPMPPGSQRNRDGKQMSKQVDMQTSKYEPPELPITHVFHTADPIPMGTCTGQTSLCGQAGYAMESTCHAGQVVIYNTTGHLGWSSNIGTHRIANLVDDLLTEDWGERVRKEWKRTHQQTKWWPWNGNKDKEDQDIPDELKKIGETPRIQNQNDCIDCGEWKFVQDDKWK